MLGGQRRILCLVVNEDPLLGGQWEDPMLGGQWRIPCLVVNEDPLLGGQWRSLAWWSMKNPMLGGQWRSLAWWSMGGSHAWWSMGGSHAWWSMKIPCLVANEGSHAWWSMGGSHAWWSMKIPCLVVNGRRRRRFLATYSHFPLSDFIWTFILFYFLSFDLKFLLNHGPRPSFTPPFPFLGL
jgi:hypothetical protein